MSIKNSIPFVIKEYPKITTDHRLIGLFDIQYTFDQDWSPLEESVMDAWLCHNCTKNFIFSKETHQLLAGGCVDNEADWEYRNSDNSVENEPYSKFFIKLYNIDRMLFEMVWLSHLNRNKD